MVNNVLLYLLFSFCVICIFFLFPSKYRKYFLAIANALFYYLCEPYFCFLLLLSMVVTYSIGLGIYSRRNKRDSKILLAIGVAFVVGILGCFKYNGFFVEAYSGAIQIILPLGLSYYSFRMISFLVDVYQEKNSMKEISFIDYNIYIAFFPQIISGPIARIDMLNDSVWKIPLTQKRISDNLGLILSGLFKKLVIAERISGYTNAVFTNYMDYPALALWMCMFFYAIQLYCDFAGYSEISIGITRLIGFECKENFNLPYFSCSVREFWKRWHISLSSWLCDYVYFPLGGNKKGIIRRNINILIVFIISGVWHGSTGNFIIWGLFHGFFNILSSKETADSILKKATYQICTFLIVSVGWVIFYFSSLTDALGYLRLMLKDFSISIEIIISAIMPFTMDYSCFAHFGVVCIIILLLFIMEMGEYIGKEPNMICRICLYLVFLILFGVFGESSFIYANF